MARKGWKVRDPQLNKIAIWNYYEGAMRDPGIDEGATTVAYVAEKGWFWYIPLPNNIISVGIVAEKDYLFNETRDLETIFQREVKNNKWIEEHVAPGKIVDQYRVTAEFSYRSRHCASDGVILAGDAFAFLDPVFSSGVYLALYSGEKAALAADLALTDNDFSAARFTEYGTDLCANIEAMRALVYSFYDHNFSFKDFIMKFPTLKGELTDCLIGNLLHDFTPLIDGLNEVVALPGKLPYGQPNVSVTQTGAAN